MEMGLRCNGEAFASFCSYQVPLLLTSIFRNKEVVATWQQDGPAHFPCNCWTSEVRRPLFAIRWLQDFGLVALRTHRASPLMREVWDATGSEVSGSSFDLLVAVCRIPDITVEALGVQWLLLLRWNAACF